MAINYNIQADVYDIRIDQPAKDDVFLVDTNIWYWMTYSRASLTIEPSWASKITQYPTYISNALGVGSKILHSGLSLAELLHIIERNERKIYETVNGSIKPKEYRHGLPRERSRVVKEIQSCWGQVKSLSTPLEFNITETAADSVCARFVAEALDGYDLFILESMKSASVLKLVTDDGDFATIGGLQVFTSNLNVINTARRCGRLVTR